MAQSTQAELKALIAAIPSRSQELAKRLFHEMGQKGVERLLDSRRTRPGRSLLRQYDVDMHTLNGALDALGFIRQLNREQQRNGTATKRQATSKLSAVFITQKNARLLLREERLVYVNGEKAYVARGPYCHQHDKQCRHKNADNSFDCTTAEGATITIELNFDSVLVIGTLPNRRRGTTTSPRRGLR